MNNKTNKFISDWVLPISGISSLIVSLIIIKDIDFIPHISFCGKYPNIFCQLPIIRLILNALSLNFLVGLILYSVIFTTIYYILKKIGFKER